MKRYRLIHEECSNVFFNGNCEQVESEPDESEDT